MRTNLAMRLAMFVVIGAACSNTTPPPEQAEDVHLPSEDAPPVAPPEPVAPPTATDVTPRTEPSPVTSTTAEGLTASNLAPFPALPGTNPSAQLDGDHIRPTGIVAYMTGKAALMPASERTLQEVKQVLEDKPAITLLRVEVHTDSMGMNEVNQTLSEKRALEVARGLVKLGVSCKRIIPVGFGETKPIAANTTAEDRARNRRTEFVVVALRGRVIGGLMADGGGVVAGDPCP